MRRETICPGSNVGMTAWQAGHGDGRSGTAMRPRPPAMAHFCRAAVKVLTHEQIVLIRLRGFDTANEPFGRYVSEAQGRRMQDI